MKKIYLFILMIVLAMAVKAQDTIIFRNGDIKIVKVTEVSQTQIKYILWDFQDGPVYTYNISGIFMVKYHNGITEVYDEGYHSQKPGQQNQMKGILSLGGRGLCLDGERIYLEDASILLGPDRFHTYKSGSKQYSSGVGLITSSLLFGLLGGSMVFFPDSNREILLFGTTFAIVAGAFLPIGIVLTSVGKGRMNWAIDDYNREQREMPQRFSLSVGPSFGSVPTATGNNYTIGAGLQFQF